MVVATHTHHGTISIRRDDRGATDSQQQRSSGGSEPLTGNVAVGIEFAFRYREHSGLLNDGESFTGTLADRVDSELGRWDDVGFIEEGPTDEPLNVDFGAGAV